MHPDARNSGERAAAETSTAIDPDVTPQKQTLNKAAEVVEEMKEVVSVAKDKTLGISNTEVQHHVSDRQHPDAQTPEKK